MRHAFAILAFALLACGASAAAPADHPDLPPAAPWPNEEPREIKTRNDLVDFHHSWPLEAFSIPALNARLESEASEARAQLLSNAREDKGQRGRNERFARHESRTVWSVVSDNSRLLSLTAEIDTFAGGAERTSLYDSILWDRELDREIEVADLFVNADSAFSIMQVAYCREFSRQRVERGGEPADSEDCRAIEDLVVAPLEPAGGRGRIDRFRVLIDPYGAGSITGGSYQVDVPVTDQLRALIKPEFAVFFARPN